MCLWAGSLLRHTTNLSLWPGLYFLYLRGSASTENKKAKKER
jgi:hypothetical protein